MQANRYPSDPFDANPRPLWAYRLQMAVLWAAVAGLVVCCCWFAQVAATM
jgi:hypothetical protein